MHECGDPPGQVTFRQVGQALFLVGVVLFTPAARAADVDLLLVLAADVSRSIDTAKFELQRHGYAAAIADAGCSTPLLTVPDGRIGLTFIDWSGLGEQRMVDRLERSATPSRRKISATACRSPALLRRSHLDQRRPQFRHGPARARAV